MNFKDPNFWLALVGTIAGLYATYGHGRNGGILGLLAGQQAAQAKQIADLQINATPPTTQPTKPD